MYSGSVILILLILSLLFTIFIIIVGSIFSKKSIETEIITSLYEYGIAKKVKANKQININFYTFAVLFIVYDAEILFLFPFALAFGKLHSFVFLQAIIFILIMILSLSYAVRKNLLRFR